MSGTVRDEHHSSAGARFCTASPISRTAPSLIALPWKHSSPLVLTGCKNRGKAESKGGTVLKSELMDGWESGVSQVSEDNKYIHSREKSATPLLLFQASSDQEQSSQTNMDLPGTETILKEISSSIWWPAHFPSDLFFFLFYFQLIHLFFFYISITYFLLATHGHAERNSAWDALSEEGFWKKMEPSKDKSQPHRLGDARKKK